MADNNVENIMKKRHRIGDVPFVLSAIACGLMSVSGFFTLVFSSSIIKAIMEAIPETSLTSVHVTAIGSAWLLTSYVLFLAVYNLKKKANRDWMHFLLFLGVLIVFTANIISGILVIVSAAMHIIRDNELKKRMENHIHH